MINHYINKVLAVLILALFYVSCQKDDDNIVYSEGTNEYNNQWIYEQMKRYYYWNNEIPDNIDLSQFPKDYFSSLLSHQDRFSYTYHPSIPESMPSTLRSSFGMDISFILYEGNVYGVVLYVLSGSPAQNNGLKRGQLITTINNIPVSQANYNTLYETMGNADNVSFTIVEFTEETGFSQPVAKELTSYYTFLQAPLYNIISIGDKNIGYLQISHFDVGLAQSLQNIFNEFKSQNVNEVVLDLRYNGGGDVSSATALSILLAPNIDQDDLFITFKGNQNGGEINQSFKQSLEMNEATVSYNELRQSSLTLNRVFVLCGNNTASASEIIINNLKPYITVVTIGEQTLGKDMAGFSIEDNRAGQQGWVLFPVIYKLYNAYGKGDYSNGIVPDIELNELTNLELYYLGNQNEILLNKAINIISGNSGRKKSDAVYVLSKSIQDNHEFIILPNLN